MSKCLRYIILFIVLSPTLLFGQEQEKVVIAGVVVDADSAQTLPSVHLRVRNTTLGGVTGVDGRFRTRVHLRDTLVFSSVGYEPFVLVPGDSATERLTKLVIRMTPRVTLLEEVKIKEYVDITKYIRREYDTTVDMRKPQGTPLFERQKPKERKAVQMSAGPTGARLEGAVTAFANLFSSEYQQQKKVKELLALEEGQARQQAVREAMTERYRTMVLTAASLSQADLQRFVEAYMPPPTTLLGMGDYEVMKEIFANLKKFESQEAFLKELLENGSFEKERRP